jgi:hypothetical protein
MRARVGLACLLLLAACASTIQHPVPAGPSFESDEVRFVAPTGWEVLSSTSVSYGAGQIRLYLANQPLRGDCPDTAVEPVCQSPLADGLHRGGMLVTWVTSTCVARGCELPSAPLISVGNRQGVRVALDYGCEETGFSERSAYYATVTPQRVDILFICAREPTDDTRSAFLGFLDAIQWRIP